MLYFFNLNVIASVFTWFQQPIIKDHSSNKEIKQWFLRQKCLKWCPFALMQRCNHSIPEACTLFNTCRLFSGASYFLVWSAFPDIQCFLMFPIKKSRAGLCQVNELATKSFTAFYPSIWEDFIECSCYFTSIMCGPIHYIDTTLLDKYSMKSFKQA